MSSDLFNLQGKHILITGGTGVLGSEFARGLAEAGAKIAILGRDPDRAQKQQNELKKKSHGALVFQCDVLDEKALHQVKDRILDEWGGLDILINAAGGNMSGATISPDQNILDLSIGDLKKVMDLNYVGTVLPTKVMLEIFVPQGHANIINISSMAAKRPLSRVMGYSSSKAAIENYTQWIANELATKFGEKFRVNALAPGFFLTKQNNDLLTKSDGSLTKRGQDIIDHTPFRRFGEPQELLGTLIWLCSDASGFVTGAIVPVDGGFNAFNGV